MSVPVMSLDQVWDRLPYADAALATEHELGVVPLLDLFDADPDGLVAAVRERRATAGLGLFTPNARFATTAPTIRAVHQDAHVSLDGRFRVADERTDASLIAVTCDGQVRLALLSHSHPGVQVSRSWGEVAGATLPMAALSRPVSLTADGPLTSALDHYAWEYARRRTDWAASVIADLRRTLAATGAEPEPLSTSQYLAHELTMLEIEVKLAGAAARFGSAFRAEPPGGESVAAVLLSAITLVHRTVAIAEDLTVDLGLTHGPSNDPGWPGASACSHFGGRRIVEGELARRMSLVREVAAG